MDGIKEQLKRDPEDAHFSTASPSHVDVVQTDVPNERGDSMSIADIF